MKLGLGVVLTVTVIMGWLELEKLIDGVESKYCPSLVHWESWV